MAWEPSPSTWTLLETCTHPGAPWAPSPRFQSVILKCQIAF